MFWQMFEDEKSFFFWRLITKQTKQWKFFKQMKPNKSCSWLIFGSLVIRAENEKKLHFLSPASDSASHPQLVALVEHNPAFGLEQLFIFFICSINVTSSIHPWIWPPPRSVHGTRLIFPTRWPIIVIHGLAEHCSWIWKIGEWGTSKKYIYKAQFW